MVWGPALSASAGKVNGFLLLALLLAAVAHFRWISFSVFQYGDWRFHFAEVGQSFLDLSPWSTNLCLGQATFTLWKLPFNAVYGLLASVGLDSNITEKFLVFLPAILLPPLASFFLVKQIVRSNTAAFAGALVYSFNSYFYSINTAGHEFLTVAAAFGVMGILLFMRALSQKHTSAFLTAGLLGFFSVSYDIRMAYIAIVVSILYWLYFIVLSSNRIEAFRNTATGVGILACLFVLLNSYWLLPAIAANSLLNNEIMQRELFGNEFMNILQAIALFHPFWNGTKPEWFVVQPIPLYFFIVPILAFWGLALNRRNKDVLFFGLISIGGIFLAKQSGEPFAQLYLFLFTTVPGFGAFREASKFYFLIAIGYAVLVGALVAWLHNNPPGIKHVLFLKYLLLLLILSISAWNAKPMFTGEIETMFVERHVPDDYVCLKQHILDDQKYARVLWVPRDVPWEVNNNTHPTLSIVNMIYADWGKVFSPLASEPNRKVENSIQFLLAHPYSQQLLANSSIRYIIVPLRDTVNDGDFYHYYGGSRDVFIKQLDRLSYLRRLNIGMANSIAYENPHYRPHIYLTPEAETIAKFVPFDSIEFDVSNRSEYQVHLKNISSLVYLNFTDNYHPDWRLYFGPFSWWNMLLDKTNTLPDSSHIKSDAGFNVFYIDPNYIKRNYPKKTYKENADGSIDVDLTLYFRPHSYLNLGLMVSLLTLVGCLTYLLVSRFRRIRNGGAVSMDMADNIP